MTVRIEDCKNRIAVQLFRTTKTRMMSNLSRRKRDEFGIFLTFFKGE